MSSSLFCESDAQVAKANLEEEAVIPPPPSNMKNSHICLLVQERGEGEELPTPPATGQNSVYIMATHKYIKQPSRYHIQSTRGNQQLAYHSSSVFGPPVVSDYSSVMPPPTPPPHSIKRGIISGGGSSISSSDRTNIITRYRKEEAEDEFICTQPLSYKTYGGSYRQARGSRAILNHRRQTRDPVSSSTYPLDHRQARLLYR